MCRRPYGRSKAAARSQTRETKRAPGYYCIMSMAGLPVSTAASTALLMLAAKRCSGGRNSIWRPSIEPNLLIRLAAAVAV
jgi:hypothetical protein